jgi:hypothetical protein
VFSTSLHVERHQIHSKTIRPPITVRPDVKTFKKKLPGCKFYFLNLLE